jgi:hypothetical protein
MAWPNPAFRQEPEPMKQRRGDANAAAVHRFHPPSRSVTRGANSC